MLIITLFLVMMEMQIELFFSKISHNLSTEKDKELNLIDGDRQGTVLT